MKRFVSLKVQENVLVDPYEITTWRPIGPYTPTSPLPGNLKGKRYKGYWDKIESSDEDETYYRTRNSTTEAEVMALFPPENRKEIRSPTPRKTSNELRRDYLYLEKSIEKHEHRNTVMLKSPTVSFIHSSDCEKCGLLRVESPTFVGKLKPIPATPSGSQENLTYLPTKKLLDLKKPRSGVFINEEELAKCDETLPSGFEPRQAQQRLKNKKSKFVLSEDDGQFYATLEKSRKCIKPTNVKSTQVVFDFRQNVSGSTNLLSANKEARGWHALLVSTTAFIHSKISDARSWTSDTIDEIIKTGLSFANTWEEPPTCNLIQGLPKTLDSKGYRIQIGLEPNFDIGEVCPALTYACSDLCTKITAQFMTDTKSKGILFEVENIVNIVWRKDDIYCLFDPFERDECGYAGTGGSAGLLLNNRLSEICQTLYDNMNKLVAPNTSFKLHQIVVKQVDKVIYAKNVNVPIIVEVAKPRSIISKALSKMSIPAMPIGINSVPVNELSDLSLMIGMRKKRKGLKVASDLSLTKAAEQNEIGINEMNKKDMLGMDAVMQSIEIGATLDAVLNRIQDKIDAKCHKNADSKIPRAKSVLVKSDLGCLQRQRRRIIRGYDDDCCGSTYKDIHNPDPIDNPEFRDMPDTSQVMLGSQNLLQIVDYNESIGVIAPLLACILSTKYGIHTWQPSCLDFVLNTTRYIQDCVPMTKYQMFRAKNHHFPDIQIGSGRYSASVKCLQVGTIFNIGQMLRNSLSKSSRLVISSTVFNAAVFWKNDFWYLFDALPCDIVGIRCTDISEGVASLQRFKSLDSLISRIMYNQYVARMDQHCSVSHVSVKDVTKQNGLVKSFLCEPLPEHKEKETIARLNRDEQERIERNAQYLDELDNLIKSEKCRIKKFNKKAGIPQPPVSHRDILRAKRPIIDDGEEEGEEGNELNENVDTTSEEKPTADSIYDEILKQPYGYACVSPHLFFKIQGSACLPYRFRFRADGVRACHFCSMYAMCVVALHCNWDCWNFRTVDQCIEEGRQIYANLESVDHLRKRVLDRVTINQQNFQITIEKHDHLVDPLPFEVVKMPVEQNRLHNALNKYFEKKSYILLYFPNTTFAVIKQKCYNLFDPYASHELRPNEKHIILSQNPRTETALFTDNNSASWLCIPSLPKLIRYIRQRVRPRDLNGRFELYTIKCIATDPQPDRNYAHFMLSYALRTDLNGPPSTFEDLAKTLSDEETSWLNEFPSLLPWSRQHIRNYMDMVRYKKSSMWKQFDTEIENDLYSLFANLHPMCCAFNSTYRGRQYAGIYSIAACIAALYPMDEWNEQLMNYIVIEGDRYFETKMTNISVPEYEVSLEDLAGHVELASFSADIDIEAVVFGHLYSLRGTEFNLKKALLYFFSEPNRSFGVMQCFRKSIAFGRTVQNQYFMFDCMTVGPPVFRAWEGAAYLLLCSSLKRLLHCIILTLRVPCYNVEFHLHEIATIVTPTPVPDEEEEGEDEEGDHVQLGQDQKNKIECPKVTENKNKK